jgi:hypothetical protein
MIIMNGTERNNGTAMDPLPPDILQRTMGSDCATLTELELTVRANKRMVEAVQMIMDYTALQAVIFYWLQQTGAWHLLCMNCHSFEEFVETFLKCYKNCERACNIGHHIAAVREFVVHWNQPLEFLARFGPANLGIIAQSADVCLQTPEDLAMWKGKLERGIRTEEIVYLITEMRLQRQPSPPEHVKLPKPDNPAANPDGSAPKNRKAKRSGGRPSAQTA